MIPCDGYVQPLLVGAGLATQGAMLAKMKSSFNSPFIAGWFSFLGGSVFVLFLAYAHHRRWILAGQEKTMDERERIIPLTKADEQRDDDQQRPTPDSDTSETKGRSSCSPAPAGAHQPLQATKRTFSSQLKDLATADRLGFPRRYWKVSGGAYGAFIVFLFTIVIPELGCF